MKMNIKHLVLIASFLFLSSALSAQINPLGSQFFQNKYLANPAFAGINQGLNVNFGYREQGDKIIGTPRSTSATTEYRADKVGMGLNFYSDKAGLLNNTTIKGTFAYHFPAGNDQQEIHFGLSLGLNRLQLNNQDIVGDPSDPIAPNFNERAGAFDGDFGFAYTDENLTVEGAFNNIKNQFQKSTQNDVDYNTFFTSISYKFELTDWKILPRASYRGVKNYKDILDLGVELKTISEDFGVIGMYHTNKSLSLGLSYQHKKQWQLMSFYNTATKPMQSYTQGSFEIGLRVNIPNKKTEK